MSYFRRLLGLDPKTPAHIEELRRCKASLLAQLDAQKIKEAHLKKQLADARAQASKRK